MSFNSGPTRNELLLKFENGFGDLNLDFVSYYWKSEKRSIKESADGVVGIEDGAEDAATFELVEAFARPSKEEKEEDNVSDSTTY
jgi:hypothetical protein